MPIVDSSIVVTPNACRDVIGVKGLCTTTYPYYLDTLGISINKASKLADSSMITAKNLVDESVEMAWGDVFGDIRADGFNVNGVQRNYENFFTESNFKNAGVYTQTIYTDCDIEQIYLGKLNVVVTGTLNITLTSNADGLITTMYSGSVTDETLTININNSYAYSKVIFTLTATGTGQMLSTTDSNVIKLNAYTECSEKLFYCKYWAYLVKAVMYKATAHILNSSLFSDRYNDLIVYKRDEIALRIAQLDSSFNLLNATNRINEKGLYQLEIEKINSKLKEIIRQSYCTCCFKCDNVISTSISIP